MRKIIDVLRLSHEGGRSHREGKGDENGQYNLGLIYLRGSGVPKNMKEAEKWLKMAAEQDMSEAQNDLGVVYVLGGDGLAQNSAEAYKWLWIASKGNVVRGKPALDILLQHMTPRQIQKAEQAGRDWIKSH